MKRRTVAVIRVFRSPLDHARGLVVAGSLVLPCALGRGGTRRQKREGDGATPLGRHRILALHYRPDRGGRPRTGLQVIRIGPRDGWCDDPGSRLYNRPIRLPAAISHEQMWREDRLYDIVVDLAWNRGPIVRGRGSAIFLHSARPDFSPTEGCVAVPRRAIARLVALVGRRTVIDIR